MKNRERPSKTRKPASMSEDQRIEIRQLLEDLYLSNKWQMLKGNFLRGIAFGLGTFLGGTIVVAILIWLISQTVDIFPPVRDFAERLIESLNK